MPPRAGLGEWELCPPLVRRLLSSVLRGLAVYAAASWAQSHSAYSWGKDGPWVRQDGSDVILSCSAVE